MSGDTNIPTSVQTPNGAVSVGLSDVAGSTGNLTDIEGNVTLSIANFGTVQGDFGFQSYKNSQTGAQQIAIGATNFSAMLGTNAANLTVSGASLGLVIDPAAGAYALEATGGMCDPERHSAV